MRINLDKALAPKIVTYIPVIIFTATNALPRNPFLSFATLIIFCTLPGYSLLNQFNLRLRTGFENLFISLLLSIFTLTIVYTTISFSAYQLGLPHTLQRGPTFLIGLLLIFASSRNLHHSGQSDSLVQLGHRILRNISPKVSILITCAVLLPISAFIAVSQLNHGGSSAPSVFFLCLCISILLILFSSRFNASLTPIHYVLLYSVILALLIQTSFRGDGGFWGYDVNAEYASAIRTLHDGYWIPINDGNTYNSMLSITVLPVALSLLTKMSVGIIFKLFYAIVAALLPVAIYSILIKFVRNSIAMAVICIEVIGSISFIVNSTALCRQVIGFAFFIGILMIILTQIWSRNTQVIVILLFAFGMSFSHYSTAYLACAIFLPASLIIFLSKFVKGLNKGDSKPIVTIPLALGILLITLLWNAGINSSVQDSAGVFSAINRVGAELLPSQQENFIQRWINGVVVPSTISAEEYKNLVLATTDFKYPTAEIHQSALSYSISSPNYPKASAPFGELIPKFLGLLYIALNSITQGLVLFFSLSYFTGARRLARRRAVEINQPIHNFQNIRVDLTAITLISLLLAIFLRISSSVANFYNPERVAFQLSFIFSLPIAIILERFFTRYSAKERMLWWILPFSGFIFVQQNSGLNEYLSGTSNARISNAVAPYSQFVISSEEKAASTWIGTTLPASSFLQADNYALLVNMQNDQIPAARQIPQIAPFGLLTNSYVYLSKANLRTGIAWCPIFLGSTTLVNFGLPMDYLNKNLSLVYSSGGSRVYR